MKKKKKERKQTKTRRCLCSALQFTHTMERLSRRTLDRIYSAVLLAVVVLSWSYVIYASRVAALWLLDQRTVSLQQN